MNSAIILAGGNGSRYGGKKQFMKYRNKELYRHVYDKVVNVVDEVIVVGVDIPGGDTRTESVKNGLRNISDESSRVIILEAARPLVTLEQISSLLNSHDKSVSFSMPLIETIIIDGYIYPERSKCRLFQTPQAFDAPLLKDALLDNKFVDFTDETRIMYEEYGIKPTLLMGDINLYKVTYFGDLDVLKSIENTMLRKEHNE